MATYTELATKLEKWLNRENFTELTDQVEELIAMGQRRIHRLCNLRAMETANAAYTIDSQTEAVPSDFLRMKSLTIVTSDQHYEVLGRPLRTVLNVGQSDRPIYYARVGDNFYFGATPDQSYTALIIYYKPLDILSTTVASNWISLNEPELLLFAAMVEACLFLKDDKRAGVWENRFNQIKTEIETSESSDDREGPLAARAG